jgi:lysophospholipase L1-like esterase
MRRRRLPRTYRPMLELLERRDAPSVTPLDVPGPINTSDHWDLLHRQYATFAQHGQADVMFVGDSATEFWGRPDNQPVWDHYFGRLDAVNFGIKGDGTGNVLWRLNHGEMGQLTPKVVVLLIGSNDSAGMSAPQIARGVGEIIDTIHHFSPDSKVLLMGLLPRGDDGTGARNVTIAETNRLLTGMADGHYVHYLYAGQPFATFNGVDTGLMPDALHPNAAGYDLLGKAISPVLGQMLTEVLPPAASPGDFMHDGPTPGSDPAPAVELKAALPATHVRITVVPVAAAARADVKAEDGGRFDVRSFLAQLLGADGRKMWASAVVIDLDAATESKADSSTTPADADAAARRIDAPVHRAKADADDALELLTDDPMDPLATPAAPAPEAPPAPAEAPVVDETPSTEKPTQPTATVPVDEVPVEVA